MTPKEKAKELFDKYWSLEWQLYTNVKSIKRIGMTKDAAKQCAKIVVEQIIKQFHGLNKPEYVAFDCIGERQFTYEGEYEHIMTGYDMVNYWNEVLIEIDNI